MTSDIKQTITKNKVKRKQKCILNASLKELHERSLIENININISSASFCKRRPFWVVEGKESDRDTCACKFNENVQFFANALFHKL